ncbi:hypothetical protein KKA69_03890 [Patescibacteria group bacterium]|nr:hypothetical protein [Patescibacteria group bacterium]
MTSNTKEEKSSVHYKFFVSGRWRNRDNVLDLTQKIREKDYKVYCFLETSNSVKGNNDDPEQDMQLFEKLDWRNDPYVKEVFQNDMNGEKSSDAFIMLLPAGKSCHIEAGVAYGLGKKCILIGEQKEAESLYLIFKESYNSVEEFLKTI